ncbi:MAG: hypothetical protein IJA87_05810 [Clostridia bacterium]|nr:hypothetical protein [Clostridia bacterium]
MKKAFSAVVSVVIVLCAMLSGCSVELRSIDSLMRPPHTATEAELKDSINKLLGNQISYRSPESGENHSAIILRDINGDETEEAIVFYVKNDDTSVVRMCVLTRSGEKWLLVSDFAGNGSGVLNVDFVDLNNDNDEEILVTWFLFDDKSQKMLSVYTADTDDQVLNVSTRISEPYSIMAVTDVYGAGNKQLIIAYSNSTRVTDRTTLKLIGVSEGDEILLINEMNLDSRILSLLSIASDIPSGSTTPRLYIDAQVSDGQCITQVLTWNTEQRKFLSLINDIAEPDMTLRSSNLLCKDIDDDGIIEIPLRKPMSESINSDTSLGYVLEWCEINNSKLVPQEYYVVNLIENYTLYYPKEWKDKIFVKSNISTRTWDFVDMNESVLFSIIACNFEDWDETDSGATEMLMMQNDTVYFCRITAAGEERRITAADLLEYFSININSQG